MPVDPDIGEFDDVTKVAHKTGIYRIVLKTGMNGLWCDTVMGHDDRLAVEWHSQSCPQPVERQFMFGKCVLGREELVCIRLDQRVVRHTLPRDLHAFRSVSIQLVVSPKTSTKEAYIPDNQFLPFEEVDVCARRLTTYFGKQLRILRPVRFVIAMDINHLARPVSERLDGAGSGVDISSKDENLGTHTLHRNITGKLVVKRIKVQIRSDLNSHKTDF